MEALRAGPLLFTIIVIIERTHGQTLSSIAPFSLLNGMIPNLQAATLTNLPTAGLPTVPTTLPTLSSTGLTSFSSLGLPGVVATTNGILSPSQSQTTGLPILYQSKFEPKIFSLISKTSKPSSASSLDSDKEVLNNLAIALQLLIVSNLMKAPNNELDTHKETSFAKLLDMIPLSSPSQGLTSFIKSPVASLPISNEGSPTFVKLSFPSNSAQINTIPSLNKAPMSVLPPQSPVISSSMMSQAPHYMSLQALSQNVPVSISNQHIQSSLSPQDHHLSSSDTQPPFISSASDGESKFNQEMQMQPYRTLTPSIPQSSASALPNANFIGSSDFGNPFPSSILNPTAAKISRSLSIKSPYESIASDNPYADAFPVITSSRMIDSRKCSQSPYHMNVLEDQVDVFSKHY